MNKNKLTVTFGQDTDVLVFRKHKLTENKLIICSLGNLRYKISREKFEPEPGFEPRTSGFLARRFEHELA